LREQRRGRVEDGGAINVRGVVLRVSRSAETTTRSPLVICPVCKRGIEGLLTLVHLVVVSLSHLFLLELLLATSFFIHVVVSFVQQVHGCGCRCRFVAFWNVMFLTRRTVTLLNVEDCIFSRILRSGHHPRSSCASHLVCMMANVSCLRIRRLQRTCLKCLACCHKVGIRI